MIFYAQTQPQYTGVDTIQINGLVATQVNHPLFQATILHQGAQLIHFSTADQPQNWLWLSPTATYQQGVSVRGGIPICFPIFGVYDKNPIAVKRSLPTPVIKHGFARVSTWQLLKTEVDASRVCLVFELGASHHQQADYPQFALTAQARFTLTATGFNLSLTVTNRGNTPCCFSQALHTYLPTAAIQATWLMGFDGISYTDALTPTWATKTQQNDIRFNAEVDRIYHAAPNISINTPTYHANLQATGSNSTVIWNPGRAKSQQLDQFAATDYQRMFCVETANAHLDCVTLPVGDVHRLSMQLSRTQ